jgi:hypothetical protein
VSDLYEPFSDEWAPEGGGHCVFALVDGVSLNGWDDEVLDEFIAEVFNDNFFSAGGDSFFAKGSKVFVLSEVGGEANHFALVVFNEPTDYDGGIESAGISEDDAFNLSFLGSHLFTISLCKMKNRNKKFNLSGSMS